jgi:hypothetical protein
MYEVRTEDSEIHTNIIVAGWGGCPGFCDTRHHLSAQCSARERIVRHHSVYDALKLALEFA